MYIRNFLFFLLGAILVAATGCSTSKVTTTPRSAVEEALLSQSADRALNKFDQNTTLYYERFYIDDSQFEAADEQYILSALRLNLLKRGMHAVEKKEDADLIIYPRAAISAIDESGTLIGIPSIPVSFPGLGAVNLPELAFYKKFTQVGINKLGVYGIDAKNNGIAFDFGIQAAKAWYTRWTFLILISFRTTNLEEPYRTPKHQS